MSVCLHWSKEDRRLVVFVPAPGATCVAGGLYPAHHFGATRLNVADCSTRDTPFPALLASFVSALESFPEVLDFAGLGSLNRHSANWVKWVSLFVDFPPCVLGLAYPFWTLDFGLSSSVRALSVGFPSAVTVVRSFPSRFCPSSTKPSPLQALQGETFSFSCACAV